MISVCSHGSCQSQGSSALISDLEDLAEVLPLKFSQRGCLGLCGQGPNCLLETKKGSQALNHLDSFSKVISMVKKFLKAQGSDFTCPEDLLTRSKLKSDAMRLLSKSPFRPQHTAEDMLQAAELLSRAIALEDARPGKVRSRRTYELLLLRGQSLGRRSLALRATSTGDASATATAALEVLGRAMLERPRALEPLVEAAHIYAFSGDTTKAVEFYQTAITLMKELKLPKHEVARLERRVEKLMAGTQQPLDSGDGAGLWRVEDITGVSRDTCIYHLRANPPGNPHPFPHSAWHLQVFLGSTVREYTPISSASAWEDGRLELLVKTYPDGCVSRFFGTLRTVQEAREAALQNYAPLEEQNCWVHVSAPLLTLDLPSFTGAAAAPQLALVAGGTGIAPLAQIISHCVAGGVLERCQVMLLYSSRTVEDILMLDDLRRLASACCGRLQVFHTLTRSGPGARSSRSRTRLYFSGCHQHFRQEMEDMEEVSTWEGHVDEEMMRKALEMGFGTGKMTNATRIVVCGPQGLLDTVEACCSVGEGFRSEHLVLLQATKQSEAPIDSSDSSEDDEVASEDVAVAIPRISISAPALKIPKVEDPKDPKDSGPSVPSTRKPGDLLKEQLGHAQNGMTFADRVRIEAAQNSCCWSHFSASRPLDMD